MSATFSERLAEQADWCNAARTALTAKYEAELASYLETEGHLRGMALAVSPELAERAKDYGILPEESK